jgi:hypothetical protein
MVMKVASSSKGLALPRRNLSAYAVMTLGQGRSLRRGKNGALRLTSP